ncbi:MAG TPA: ABC transporter permease [Mobilitalea sp.]|nr:ABC transporter permease [Mobilitalea sp.]
MNGFKLYITRLKCLFRNRENIFWSYMFPILLASCFYFAFTNVWSASDFKTVSVAYDSQGATQDPLKEAMTQAKVSNGTPIFSIIDCPESEAKELLKNGKIEAYIVGSSDPALYIKQNGMNQTIIKDFLDSYRRMSATVSTVIKENPNAMQNGLMKDVTKFNSYINEKANTNKPDAILIYYYALIAYACIFSANWGLDEVVNIQADQSCRGARLNVSPVNKMKLFLCNILAAFTAHIISILLLLGYMRYVLKIEFGDKLVYILITCISGSIAGIMIGAAVGIYVKKSKEVKEAVLTLIVLGGGFLSGLMFADIKYYIAQHIPVLRYINPVTLVSDALYSLYYYDTYERFILNISLLYAITILLGLLSYIGIRRKNYASI